jgi:hypothetical protein
MAKYTEAQCVEMVAEGEARSFEKKVRCFLIIGEKDVIYVTDDGVTLSDHLTLRDRNGVVYALEDRSPFERWWKKVTRVASGLAGILTSPVASFIAGFTGWPLAKLAEKLAGFEEEELEDIEARVRDEIGSHKGGRLVLAVEEAIKHGLGTPDELEELGKLLGGND